MPSNHRGFPRSVIKPGLAGAFAVFVFTLSPPGRAATMLFEATNLADTTPGEDLWQFTYRPVDFSFTANQGFTIFFDLTLFTKLQSPPTFVNADWDLLSVQPDPSLSSNGFYDAMALHTNPSLADPFTVTFVWLRTGVPGAQSFMIYDTDFSTLQQGLTFSPDSDGDGASDSEELLAGTNPLNPASVFRITAIARSVSGVEVRFPTVLGKNYRVEYTDHLSANQWSVLVTSVGGTGGTIAIINTATLGVAQRFYRAAIIPQ